MLASDELRGLADDIKAHGLQHPIVLHEGKVLDGRNRLAACEMVGVEPRFVAWEPNGTSPTTWVIATNLHRRHLTTGQRAAIAADALPLLEAEAKERQTAHLKRGAEAPSASIDADGETPSVRGKASVVAAQQFNVSPASVERAKYLKAHHPDAFEDVKEGRATLNAASVAVGYEGRTAQEVGDHPNRRRQEPGKPDKSRVATQARRERIAAMVRDGYRDESIAAAVGLSLETLRNNVREMGLPTYAEKMGKSRTVEADRVMEGIVTAAMPSEEAVRALDWARLDREQFETWEQRLSAAIRALGRVRDRLRRESRA